MSFNQTKIQSPPQTTHEGGRAFALSDMESLYTLVAGSLMSGDSFYETQAERLKEFRALVEKVARHKNGPEFIAALTKYAREQLFLRTTPAMLVAEAFHLKLSTAEQAALGGWKRADDHLESLAYAKAVGIKRSHRFMKALAKRLNGLNEYAAVKYARTTKSFAQADAIRLSHPKPKDDKTAAIFKFLVKGWSELSEAERALVPTIAKLKDEGESLTWEQLISKHGSSQDTWEKAIEVMGYMALLRNLRNMVSKNVSKDILDKVAAYLSNPENVRNSKQLPYRFLSAWRALPSDTPKTIRAAVAEALDLSAKNMEELPGRTLVLIDVSGSMSCPVSDRSGISCADAAATLGAVIAQRMDGSLWAFATNCAEVRVVPGTPVLQVTENVLALGARLGGGTNTAKALSEALAATKKAYDRIIVLSDMQSADDVQAVLTRYRRSHPETSFYGINLAGYRNSIVQKGKRTHDVAGFSDRILSWISSVETSDPVTEILRYGSVQAEVEAE